VTSWLQGFLFGVGTGIILGPVAVYAIAAYFSAQDRTRQR